MAQTRHHKLTVKTLQRAGLPITSGKESIPKSQLPKRSISLQEVHRRLGKFKGSLAEEVARIRETE